MITLIRFGLYYIAFWRDSLQIMNGMNELAQGLVQTVRIRALWSAVKPNRSIDRSINPSLCFTRQELNWKTNNQLLLKTSSPDSINSLHLPVCIIQRLNLLLCLSVLLNCLCHLILNWARTSFRLLNHKLGVEDWSFSAYAVCLGNFSLAFW